MYLVVYTIVYCDIQKFTITKLQVFKVLIIAQIHILSQYTILNYRLVALVTSMSVCNIPLL